MENNDIMNAVKTAIENTYPGEPVYLDRLPKDFQRPSFALELQTETLTDVNIGLVRHSVTVLVTCFVSVDAYSDSSREALNSRQSGILAIFGRGVLQVGDRTPSVAAAKGTGTPDFAEVTAVFSWTDTRPGYVDEDTAPESESGVPLMEHYTLRVGATPPANRKKE